MCYKENLSLRIINVSFLSQCMLREVTIQRQKHYVIVTYLSPTQTKDRFDDDDDDDDDDDEVTIQRQKRYVIVTYLSPTQTKDGFDEFLSNFETLLNFVKQLQLPFAIMLDDFNARFE